MADPKQIKLTSYYTELKKFVDNANYQKVIKSCNKLLAEFENETKAWQCKAVAYINLGQFKEALDFIKKAKCIDQLLFEKAYCEYRLNDVESACKTIETCQEPLTQRDKELKAQILYKLERYEECYTTYRDIIRTTSDEFDLERQTNVSAVSVHRALEDPENNDNVISDNSSYELVYNSATHYIALGRMEQALAQLQLAETQCRDYLIQEEGASEEEVNEEVAIIRIQQGYCLQMLFREKEALAVYNSVLKTKPEDPSLLACINNNMVTINRTANVFDSRKRMKTATAAGLEHKLTSRQRGAIALNQCLLAYHTHQTDVCVQEAEKLKTQFPNMRTSAALVEAAQLKVGQVDEVVSILENIGQQDSNQSFVKLATVQILLNHGAITNACDVLNSLEEQEKYRAGIVSALVALYMASSDRSAASNILSEAVLWHKNNKSPSNEMIELWRHAADFHMRIGDSAKAATHLMELHKLYPDDLKTLAQLITAYSQFDTKTAQSLSKKLPLVSQLVSDLNIDALETSIGQKYFKRIAAGKGGDISPGMPSSPKSPISQPVDVKKANKNKKRKPRLPKVCVEGVLPDPERWLPRWQRKGYKKKKDRRNKDVGKGTQGVSSEAADKFDITKNVSAQAKPAKPVVPQQTKSAPRNVQKKGAKPKKKKSGW